MSAQFEAAGISAITLTPGASGVFEITIDGQLQFSKRKLGRFPTEAEVSALISAGRHT